MDYAGEAAGRFFPNLCESVGGNFDHELFFEGMPVNRHSEADDIIN
jgi:hypothetical protein